MSDERYSDKKKFIQRIKRITWMNSKKNAAQMAPRSFQRWHKSALVVVCVWKMPLVNLTFEPNGNANNKFILTFWHIRLVYCVVLCVEVRISPLTNECVEIEKKSQQNRIAESVKWSRHKSNALNQIGILDFRIETDIQWSVRDVDRNRITISVY